MQSRKTSSHDKNTYYPAFSATKGFTLVEIIVSMAIFTIILAFSAIASMDSFRGYLFRSEKMLIVSTLTRARAMALDNVHGVPRGVCYDEVAHHYIIFRGTNCIPGVATNEVIVSNPEISVTGLSTGVVFSQLAATTTGASISITDGVRTEHITINYEGTIND